MNVNDFKHTMKALNDFGQKIVDNYRAELEACNYQDGQLYRTLSYSVKMNSSSWLISISLEEYWKYIEYGRRPGKMPPLDVIEKWINVRQILPRPLTLKSGKSVVPTIPQLSFLIARKIGRDGIQPRPFFKQSFEEAKREYLAKIEEAIIQDIKESLVI